MSMTTKQMHDAMEALVQQGRAIAYVDDDDELRYVADKYVTPEQRRRALSVRSLRAQHQRIRRAFNALNN
jgi:hypothetical protein